MPNKNYQRGRRWEYELRKRLSKDGSVVLRTAASHGPVDLVVVTSHGDVTFIQCKVTKSKAVAEKLKHQFMIKPPLRQSNRYTQAIAIKVQGGENVWALV